MRTIILVLALTFGGSAFAQDNLQAIKFIFSDKAIVDQELSKEGEDRKFTFMVEGILTPEHKAMLIQKVNKVRGVESFSIEENNAKLVLYRYATSWRYWSMFIKHSGIGGIQINGQLYTEKTILSLDL